MLLAALVPWLAMVPAGDAGMRPLPVTGYVVTGTSPAVLDREAPALHTLGVDGVNLPAAGGSVPRPDAGATRLLRRAHRDGLPAELLVGNFDERLGDFSPELASRVLRHPGRRARVVRQLVGIVRSQGWDGVAVDLESLRRADGAGLRLFVADLARRLPGRRTVSVAVSASTDPEGYAAQGYRLPGLARSADRLVLMAYDQHGPTWSGPGPVGALPWQRAALAAITSRVPAGKVDLGVAGYGYSWPVSGTGHDYTVGAARAAVAADGASPVWHPRQGEWSARLGDGTVLWWSDGRSWQLRAELARERHLHGLALWRLGSADPLPQP